MHIYTVSIVLMNFAFATSTMVGMLITLATRCSAENAPFVNKSATLGILAAMMCACIYYKLTMAYIVELYTKMTTVGTHPPPPTEAVALLADTSCESQSTDRCIVAQRDDAAAHKESWGLTGSTAITGISREDTPYKLLSDSKSREMSISACAMSDS